MPDTSTQTKVLEQVLSIWKRRKSLAIPAFLLPFALLVSLVMYLPSLYRATATLLVEGQQLPESFVRSTVTSELEGRLQSMSRDVLSNSRIGDLVDRFGLQPDSASRDEAIERTRQAVTVETRGSGTSRRGASTVNLSVSYDARDPATAATVANTLASFFIEENFKLRDRLAVGTTEFLRAQLEQTRLRLVEQEQRIGSFRAKYLGELPQQMQANLVAMERADTALRLNLDGQHRLAQRREALLADLAALATAEDVPAGTPDADARRLSQLRQQLTDLQTRFTDRYPEVVQLKSEIAAIEARLAKGGEGTTAGSTSTRSGGAQPPSWNPQVARMRQSLAETEAELVVLKTEEKRLREAASSYQARVENTPKREQEFQQISRDYQATQELYQSTLKRLNEAELSETMEQSQKGEQFRLTSPASPPSEPVQPKRPRLLMMALVASLGLAALAVAIPEYLDSSFHTVDDLRQFTTLPILTVIPRIVTEADVQRQRLRTRLGVLGTALSVVLGVVASYFIAHDNWALLTLVSR